MNNPQSETNFSQRLDKSVIKCYNVGMEIKFRVRIKQELFQTNMPETLVLSGFAGGGGTNL